MQVQPENATRADGHSPEPSIRTEPGPHSVSSAQSTLGLVGQLIDELSALFRQEVALARAEIKESIHKATAGLMHVAIGGFVLFVALLTIVAAGVLALALVLPAWLAALAIGVGIGGIGYGVLRSGTRRLDVTNLKPTRVPQSLRKDAAILARKHQQP